MECLHLSCTFYSILIVIKVIETFHHGFIESCHHLHILPIGALNIERLSMGVAEKSELEGKKD